MKRNTRRDIYTEPKESFDSKGKILLFFISKELDERFEQSIINLNKNLIIPLRKHYNLDIATVTSETYNDNFKNIIGDVKYKIISLKRQTSKICDLFKTVDFEEYDWYIKVRPDLFFYEEINFKKLEECCKNSINCRVRHYFGPKIDIPNSVSISNPEIISCQKADRNIVNPNLNDFKRSETTIKSPDDAFYIFHKNIAKQAFSDFDVEKMDPGLLSQLIYNKLLNKNQPENFVMALFKLRDVNINIIGVKIHFKCNKWGDLKVDDSTISMDGLDVRKFI